MVNQAVKHSKKVTETKECLSKLSIDEKEPLISFCLEKGICLISALFT